MAQSMAATGPRTTTPEPLYGSDPTTAGRRVTVRDIAAAKARGEKWPMLTAYDALTAGIFDRAGIPVMAHLGLTPQSVNAFGGYRVQGRGEEGERLLHEAKVLEAAGAFSVVLECVPASLAARVTEALTIPTIGIGAGPSCDAQVLVWQDMARL